jgi:type I restriction enzyme S subunit
MTKLLATLPDGKICDFIDQKIRNDTPEEYVRQNIERRLVLELGYSPEQIEVEYSIKQGSKTVRMDLAIFREGEVHNQEHVWIIIECKKDSIQPSASVIVHIEPEHLKRVLIPDLPPIRRIAIGRLMCKAGELRDEANQLLDQADGLLHERLNLPYLNSIVPTDKKTSITKIKASQLLGRLEGSFHDPVAIAAEKQLHEISCEITTVGDSRVTKQIRPITKFRKRTYVEKGGIPLLSSKQIFQIDPVDVKKLAKGAHTKDLPEIQLEENMIAVTRSGTIGRVQIFPAYMAQWTASEHATRFLAAEEMNPGYVYAWLASDYGYCFISRYSYGSVILEVDKEMFSAVPIPLPESSIILVLKANQLRDEAWRNEQEAINKLENLIAKKQTPQLEIDTVQEPLPSDKFSFDPDTPPIWELVAEISAQVPDEEWQKLPTDLARRFDYYQKQRQGQD